MQTEHMNHTTSSDAGIAFVKGVCEQAKASGRYHVVCIGPDGKEKWIDEISNLVTTAGKNLALDTIMAGSGYNATWYMGLISGTGYTTGPDAADIASSHSGWAEDQNYTQFARPTAAWSAAAAGSKSLSAALTFSINNTTTVKGCFLTTISTKGGTTGTLYSAGLFTGGDKSLGNGDTLQVSYTATM